MDQLFQPVRRRCRRRDKLVFHALEFGKKRLIGLAAKAPQNCRLIQHTAGESFRIYVTVSDTLIVRHVQLSVFGGFFHVGDVLRLFHAQKRCRIVLELLSHAKREHNQRFPALMLQYQAAVFELLNGFSKTKAFKQRPSAAVQGPHNRVPLMRFQDRA